MSRVVPDGRHRASCMGDGPNGPFHFVNRSRDRHLDPSHLCFYNDASKKLLNASLPQARARTDGRVSATIRLAGVSVQASRYSHPIEGRQEAEAVRASKRPHSRAPPPPSKTLAAPSGRRFIARSASERRGSLPGAAPAVAAGRDYWSGRLSPATRHRPPLAERADAPARLPEAG
jgi:hypothetical protein